MAEKWEQSRACVHPPKGLRVDPAWFDEDADTLEREHAAAVCMVCPVRAECATEVERDVLAGRPVKGFYAGKLWTVSRRVNRVAKEQRACACVMCPNMLLVPVNSTRVRYCSRRCAERARWTPSLRRAMQEAEAGS